MRVRLEQRTEEITEAVIGAAFEVSHVLGVGFLETLYKRALSKELAHRKLHVEEEVAYGVKYKGDPIGTYRADLVVEKTVIVELKVAEAICEAHVAQALSYLRVSGLPVALILNFGVPRVGIRRVIP